MKVRQYIIVSINTDTQKHIRDNMGFVFSYTRDNKGFVFSYIRDNKGFVFSVHTR